MSAANELMKMTSHQVNAAGFDKAILAIGSCEAHGPHLLRHRYAGFLYVVLQNC